MVLFTLHEAEESSFYLSRLLVPTMNFSCLSFVSYTQLPILVGKLQSGGGCRPEGAVL